MQLLLLLQDAAAGRVVVRKSLCYATRRARAEQLQQPEQRVRYPSDPRPRSINTRHTLYPAVLYTPCIIEGTSTVGHINVVVVYCCCCCRPTVVSSKRKKKTYTTCNRRLGTTVKTTTKCTRRVLFLCSRQEEENLDVMLLRNFNSFLPITWFAAFMIFHVFLFFFNFWIKFILLTCCVSIRF